MLEQKRTLVEDLDAYHQKHPHGYVAVAAVR